MGKKVLVTRFSSLGDVAMLAVILPEILTQNPDMEIIMVSRLKFQKVFPKHERLKFIGVDIDGKYDGIWGLKRLSQKLKNENPQYFADCHDVLRTKILRRLLKIPNTAYLNKHKEEKKKMTRKKNKVMQPIRSMHECYADVFRELGFRVTLSHQLKNFEVEKSGIGFAPFAMYKEKMLPEDKGKELALRLAEMGHEVFLFGGGPLEDEILGEWEVLHPNITSLAGKFDFKEEKKVIRRLLAMIAMDSANMHLASLEGTRVVSIWGATHPYLGFLGYGQKLEDCVQIKDLFCRPCSVFGNKDCYRKNLECLEKIEVDEIISTLERNL